jgi:hypothetical protein
MITLKGYGISITVDSRQITVKADTKMTKTAYDAEQIVIPYERIVKTVMKKGGIFTTHRIHVNFIGENDNERKIVLYFIPIFQKEAFDDLSHILSQYR